MYLIKIGAFMCVAGGIVLVGLAVIVPEARLGLAIGAIACFGSAWFNLWLYRYLVPAMKNLPKPEGTAGEDITTMRGSMRIGRAMRQQNLEKMKGATEMLQQMNRANELQERGLKAKVEVLSMRDTGQLINFDPVLEFDLRVQPEAGELYHVSDYRQVVSKILMARINVGGSYSVFVDAKDPNSLYISDWR